MPIFTYKCKECGEEFTAVLVRIPREGDVIPYPRCPFCGGKVKRLITAANFTINGSSSKNNYK